MTDTSVTDTSLEALTREVLRHFRNGDHAPLDERQKSYVLGIKDAIEYLCSTGRIRLGGE